MQNQDHKKRYAFIDLLRVISCLLVVFHHVLLDFGNSPLAIYYIKTLKPFFLTVPLYLTISGFVHYERLFCEKFSFVSEIKKDFKRIMVPYFSISFLILVSKEFLSALNLGRSEISNYDLSKFALLFYKFFFAGAEGHLYFLEILFSYLIIVSILMPMLKKGYRVEWVFIFLIILDFVISPYYLRFKDNNWSPFNLIISFLSGIKYFVLGLVLQKNYFKFKNISSRMALYFWVLDLILFICVKGYLPHERELLSAVLVVTYFAAAAILIRQSFPIMTNLAQLTFGIYLFHQPFGMVMAKMFVNYLKVESHIIVLVTFVACLLMTSGIVYFVKRFKVLRALFFGEKINLRRTQKLLTQF